MQNFPTMRLKLISFLTIVLPLFGFSQFDTLFKHDKINLLTVAIDYEDYSYSGASLNYYDCEDCTFDSLPYGKNYVAPSDFGSMSLYLYPSMEVFFSGTIVWMGQGQQSHPVLSSSTAAPYDFLTSSLPVPPFLSVLDVNGEPMANSNETDLAWDAVSRVRLVQLLAEENYDVVCYLYAPTVGAFDPGPAKWLFFFYKNGFTTQLSESTFQQFHVYPNPVKDLLTVNHQLEGKVHFELKNLEGKMLQQGDLNTNNQLSVNDLNAGMYVIEITNQFGKSHVVKWIKD